MKPLAIIHQTGSYEHRIGSYRRMRDAEKATKDMQGRWYLGPLRIVPNWGFDHQGYRRACRKATENKA